VHALVVRRAPVQEFFESVPHLAYAHANKINVWKTLYHTPVGVRSWPTRPIIFVGPPRSGKSHRVRSLCDPADVYFKSDADKWWPGYTGQSDVVIDEMNGQFMSWGALLRMFESAPLTLQLKGGEAVFLARRVFMTSNVHPQFWYKQHQNWDDLNAFRARIEEFGELYVVPPRSRVEGTLVFHDPVRDLDLLPCTDPSLIPVPVEVSAQYGVPQRESY